MMSVDLTLFPSLKMNISLLSLSTDACAAAIRAACISICAAVGGHNVVTSE
jgi:hypothetical protein